jgi:N-acetylglucosaminyldiphosphoundecaprenol N-acetyl-beta-D-mannosaminyltransferase
MKMLANKEMVGDSTSRPRLVTIGGLSIAALGRQATATLMVQIANERSRAGPPLLFTSANGEVISKCSNSAEFRRLFADAWLVSADGQPLVIASRLFGECELPERVATTDLFHDVARLAIHSNVSFAIYGATADENARALRSIRRIYPQIQITASSHGYLTENEQRKFVAEVAGAKTDILWVCLGIPNEQQFYYRWRSELAGVGVVKTGGGLLNFLSGSCPRAPRAMQNVGLEWLFRVSVEPRRLFFRYLRTNPHAAVLLLFRTGVSLEQRRTTQEWKSGNIIQSEYRAAQKEPDPVSSIK